ncbi:MAG: hypothetical protein QNJ72_08565 [Pleurocapsa sp. MO_226.B13]|nr:hypothetical protein [Pleurocapsa sp. MO_226.B13]
MTNKQQKTYPQLQNNNKKSAVKLFSGETSLLEPLTPQDLSHICGGSGDSEGGSGGNGGPDGF